MPCPLHPDQSLGHRGAPSGIRHHHRQLRWKRGETGGGVPQRAAHLDVWQTGVHNPSFAAFAELCGARGARVETADRLDDAVASALAHDGPALVEVMTDVLLV